MVNTIIYEPMTTITDLIVLTNRSSLNALNALSES